MCNVVECTHGYCGPSVVHLQVLPGSASLCSHHKLLSSCLGTLQPAQLAGVSTAVLLVYYAILGYFAVRLGLQIFFYLSF